MITARAFANNRYAVLGLARSGLATVEALLASGAKVTAWDDREEARAAAPQGANIEDFVGGDLTRFDSIVVTPGLPLNRHPIAPAAKAAGVEIIGDIELFARARPELPPHKVVGITGTNGKSTTTALVHHILKTAGVPTTMGGNIGLPILAQEPLPEGGVYVLELSSYQIDLTKSLDCDIAVLLNITPDHLDRYDSFEDYAASKARLFEMQTDRHPQVISRDSAASYEIYEEWWFKDHDRVFDVSSDQILDQSNWLALAGPHNAENAAAAIAVGKALGLDAGKVDASLATYPGLPHRMERVRDLDGVLFVNDSKATNAEAAAPALAAYPRIRWIVGGQAKTESLGDTERHLGHVVKAYAIGEAGPMFARLLRDKGVEVADSGTLDAAVCAAAAEAQSGETVLLSPACASFDQFANFEARGDAFRQLVSDL